MKETDRFTYQEIVEMFRNNTALDEKFRALVLSKFDAIAQAMYNACESPEVMRMTDTHGDPWVESHNEIVTLFQRYCDNTPACTVENSQATVSTKKAHTNGSRI